MTFDFKRARPALGTIVEVSVGGVEDELAFALIGDVFDLIETLEHKLSRHRPESDIARINSANAGDIVAVSLETLELLTLSMKLSSATEGLFDVTIPGQSCGILSDIDIFESSVLVNKPVLFDLGGIGKGFIVDKAFELLETHEIDHIKVNAGGDLRIRSKIDQPLYVKHPSLAVYVEIASGCSYACATSSDCHRQFRNQDWGLYNPEVGFVGYQNQSISVVSPRCSISDALTKVVALKPDNFENYVSPWQAYGVLLS